MMGRNDMSDVCHVPGGDNEVQRTMLEIVNQLDGFDSRGNIKVRMAHSQLQPHGRLDRAPETSRPLHGTQHAPLLQIYTLGTLSDM